MVPELRFNEFKINGEWREISLIDVADKKVKWSFTGGPFGSNLKASDYKSVGVRVIQLQNIGDGEFHDDYKIFTSEEKADELLSCNIYPGDIILSKMGDPVGRACLIPKTHGRYVMCSDGIRLVIDEKRFSKYFIYTLINSAQFRSLVEKSATGSTRKRIGLDDLKNISMIVPVNLNEQEKIAECLSSLDELITAHNQNLEALQSHKKGLMQQLFPAEGETVPKLRFVEFRDSGEWKELPIGNAAEIITGNTPPTNDASNYGGKRFFVSPADISESRYITETKTTLSEKGYSLTRRLKENSVLFVCIGSTIGKIAQNKYECATNQQINSLVPFEEYSSDYIYSALEFKASKIADIAGRQAVPIINKSFFSAVLVSFPTSKEQQKIGECLSTLDELIAAHKEKIAALRKHKKGLMQGLFPNLENAEVIRPPLENKPPITN